MIYTGGRIIHTTGGRSGNSSPAGGSTHLRIGSGGTLHYTNNRTIQTGSGNSPPAGGSAPVFSLEFIGIPILYIIIGIIVLIGIIAGVMLL